MIRVYMNYPTYRIMIHADPECTYFQRPEEPRHRFVRVNPSTITNELQSFRRKEYAFASTLDKSSMWIEVDFGDREFEDAVLEHIRGLLAEHYTPFATAEVRFHFP